MVVAPTFFFGKGGIMSPGILRVLTLYRRYFDLALKVLDCIVTILFGILYCGCFNSFCNMWVCVCVGFVMCGCICVGFVMCGCVYVCVGVCMCGFCNVWVF